MWNGHPCSGEWSEKKTCFVAACSAEPILHRDPTQLPTVAPEDVAGVGPWWRLLIGVLVGVLACGLLVWVAKQFKFRLVLVDKKQAIDPEDDEASEENSRMCLLDDESISPGSRTLSPAQNSEASPFAISAPTSWRRPVTPTADVAETEVQTQQVKCPHGHVLEDMSGSQRVRKWTCDVRFRSNGAACPSGRTALAVHDCKRYRCQECNFDICEDCHRRMYEFSRTAGPSSDVKVGRASRWSDSDTHSGSQMRPNRWQDQTIHLGEGISASISMSPGSSRAQGSPHGRRTRSGDSSRGQSPP